MSVADPVLEDLDAAGVLAVLARRGVAHSQLSSALGVEVPRSGCARTRTIRCIASSPGIWLLIDPVPAADWMQRLETAAGALASLVDQTGGYQVFRLAGTGSRAALQRMLAVDLYPDHFGAHSAITTMTGYIDVTLWSGETGDTFELAIPRSYARSFRDTWKHAVTGTSSRLPGKSA